MAPVSHQGNRAVRYKKLLSSIKSFELEKAVKICRRYNVRPAAADMDRLIIDFIEQMRNCGTDGLSPYMDQRLKALKRIRDYGCDSETIIKGICLPRGYNGKILMVRITGGEIGERVCLRSGDIWHREILQNTRNEIRNLGFPASDVFELGGAYVAFESRHCIVISGTSDDYGSCNKVLTASLIRKAFPHMDIVIRD